MRASFHTPSTLPLAALLLCLLVGMAAPSHANSTASISLPVIVNRLQLGGTANAVAVVGSTAYVGIGPRLHIFGVADPAIPTHHAQSPVLPGIVQDIDVADGLAYLAVDYGLKTGGALYIFDVSDPENPVQSSRWLCLEAAYRVQVSGSATDRLAYLAADDVYILDVSKPTAPVQTGLISTPGYAGEVKISGNLLYVLDSYNLLIYDIMIPEAPTLVGEFTGAWPTIRMALHGGYAYIANTLPGMTVVDISNPANPISLGSYDTAGLVWDIAIDGNTAYLADGPAGITVLDISDQAHPAFMGSYNTPGFSTALVFDDDLIYLADGPDELRIVDVSNPAAPALLSWWHTAGIPYSMHATAQKLVTADISGRLHIYDSTGSTALVEQALFDGIPRSTLALDVAGGYAYLAGDYEGLVILDITTYGSIKVTGRLSYSDELVYDITTAGNYAYLANMHGADAGGLRIVDISNPYQPQQVGQVDATNGGFSAIQVRSSLAYVAGDGKLMVFNVSNPTAPVQVGDCDLDEAVDLVVVGDYAYVASRYEGISIVEISNPAAPQLVGKIDNGEAFSVVAAGDVLYVADRSSGLWVADISNPLAPRVLASYPAPYDIFSVASDGSRAFCSDFEAGLMLFEMGAIQSTDFIYMPMLPY